MSCSFRAKSADTSGTRKGSLARSPYTATEEAAAALVRICRVEGGHARPVMPPVGHPERTPSRGSLGNLYGDDPSLRRRPRNRGATSSGRLERDPPVLG